MVLINQFDIFDQKNNTTKVIKKIKCFRGIFYDNTIPKSFVMLMSGWTKIKWLILDFTGGMEIGRQDNWSAGN